MNRGYTRDTLLPLFYEVTKAIDNRAQQLSVSSTTPSASNPPSTGRQLFLHWEFHPNDISRQQIQKAYRETLGPVLENKLGVDKLTIAYSNPPNLRRLLTKTQLKEPEGERVSSLVEKLKQPSANL